jgi:hypothetical protein
VGRGVVVGAGVQRKIIDVAHPEHLAQSLNWQMYRLTYEAGDAFIYNYLVKYSARESNEDFFTRRRITYVPAFAKTAVDEVKNSIYQRTVDVTREGGPRSYQDAIRGDDGGVDLNGSTMNSFIGIEVLPELLTMRKVGIYVDMPALDPGISIAEKGDKRPYVYIYKAEDIKSWVPDDDYNKNGYKALLLKENNWGHDEETGLPTDLVERYRYLVVKETPVGRRVFVTYYNNVGDQIIEQTMLQIDKIPFHVLEITDSLLSNAARYQIALMNLASSDMGFCLLANFPFYVEQFDAAAEQIFNKQPDERPFEETQQFNFRINTETQREIRVGATTGRRYPKNLEQPAFINPSSEPTQLSMEKQKQIKEEIRELVGLSLSNVRPKMASAESKGYDQQGLEAGLSYIGLVLQYGEAKVAEYWAMYEGSSTPARIQYPESYSLESSAERLQRIENLTKQLDIATSLTLRRRIAKQLAYLTVGCYVRHEEMQKIYREIDAAEVILPGMDSIIAAITAGFVSLEAAARAYGIPIEIVTQAADEHAARLDRIAKAQTPPDGQARGVRDLGSDPNAGKDEKADANDTADKDKPEDQTRGAGK